MRRAPRREHEELEILETGLFNTKAPPVALRGLQKYAVVFLNVISLRFWAALQVRGTDVKFCHCMGAELNMQLSVI
jgi:hypothetical protein